MRSKISKILINKQHHVKAEKKKDSKYLKLTLQQFENYVN